MRGTALEKGKYIYRLVDAKTLRTKRAPNPFYDPNYKTPRKPSYCKGKVCFTCFDKNCPHLAVADGSD